MEYLRQHGSFDDVPLNRMRADFARVYPGWRAGGRELKNADFNLDVSTETRS